MNRALKYLPNLLTLLRFLVAPVFCYAILTKYMLLGLSLLVAGCLTDLLDGVLARRWGACSNFGHLADPIADKVLLLSLFSVLSTTGWCPQWFIALLLASTLLQAIGLILIRTRTSSTFRPRLSGKLNTAIQYSFGTLCFAYSSLIPDSGVLSHWILLNVIYGGLATTHILVFLKYFSQSRALLRWDWPWATSF